LEKTLEADISILLKPGHFYFALTQKVVVSFDCSVPAQMTPLPNKTKVPISVAKSIANGCRLVYNGDYGQDSNEHLFEQRAEAEAGEVVRQDGRTRR